MNETNTATTTEVAVDNVNTTEPVTVTISVEPVAVITEETITATPIIGSVGTTATPETLKTTEAPVTTKIVEKAKKLKKKAKNEAKSQSNNLLPIVGAVVAVGVIGISSYIIVKNIKKKKAISQMVFPAIFFLF